MISTQTSALATHLSKHSSPSRYPIDHIDWHALNNQQLWLPESLISIYGSTEYDSLSELQRIKLSHVELLHFIEFGLWLENMFINRLRESVDVKDDSPNNKYNLHIIREETEHSLMFMKFFEYSGYSRVSINSKKLIKFEKIWSYCDIKSSLFWTFVLAGEEMPLRMNKFMLANRENVNKTVADIVKIHTIDESRHVTHANAMLRDALHSSRYLSKQLIRLLMPKLIKQFADAFYYPTQDVYTMAGLDSKTDWIRVAKHNKYRQTFIATQLENILRPLSRYL